MVFFAYNTNTNITHTHTFRIITFNRWIFLYVIRLANSDRMLQFYANYSDQFFIHVFALCLIRFFLRFSFAFADRFLFYLCRFGLFIAAFQSEFLGNCEIPDFIVCVCMFFLVFFDFIWLMWNSKLSIIFKFHMQVGRIKLAATKP